MLRSLIILHGALLTGQLMMVGAFIYLSDSMKPNTDESNKILMFACPLILVLCIFLSQYIYKQKVNDAKQLPEFKDKMSAYFSGNVLQFALLEAPCLICAFAFFITGNNYFLFGSAIAIACFVFFRPSKQKTIDDLGLYDEEIYALD